MNSAPRNSHIHTDFLWIEEAIQVVHPHFDLDHIMKFEKLLSSFLRFLGLLKKSQEPFDSLANKNTVEPVYSGHPCYREVA